MNSRITIINTDTQATRIVQTDGNGFYTVTNLPIGSYNVNALASRNLAAW